MVLAGCFSEIDSRLSLAERPSIGINEYFTVAYPKAAPMQSPRYLSWIVTCVVLVLFTGCASGSHTSGPQTIRIMTYNIHHGVGLDSAFDFYRFSNVIINAHADIVALQDVDRNVARTRKMDLMTKLADLTGMTYTYMKSMDIGGGENGNGLLTRFPILEEKHVHFRLQSSTQECSLLQLVLDVKGTETVFLNTELNRAGNDSLQSSNVSEILDIAAQYPNTPVILVGCMNITPESKSMTMLRKGFRDIWAVAGSGNGFTHPSNAPQNRFDYIFVSNQKVPNDTKNLEVSLSPVSATVLASNASDHLPLLVALKVVSE